MGVRQETSRGAGFARQSHIEVPLLQDGRNDGQVQALATVI
jgi:hypothetical protein